MQIVRDLAGYSYGRSDLVRRAMSKKKADVMAQEEQYFIYGKPADEKNPEVPGCIRNGIPAEAAKAIFDDMVKFASYAFNKSHAAAYAVLAYQTAWLKYHYPAEFMAALMTSVSGDFNQIGKYIRNCRDNGIEVLPPDINHSEKKFSVHDGAVRFGFMGIKNLGENPIDEIIRARKTVGRFTDFESFISSIDVTKINKKAVESLIRAGAFDSVNPNRAQLLAVYETLMESAHNTLKNNVAGQMSLFNDFSEDFSSAASGAGVKIVLPDIRNFDKPAILAMEKEILGVYVSGHPLEDHAARIREVSSVDTELLSNAEENENLRDGMRVTIAGMIQSKRTMVTKKQAMMAFLQIEDLYGVTEVVVFPNTYEKVKNKLREDRVIVIRGNLQFREDEQPKILASAIDDIEEFSTVSIDKDVYLTIPSHMDPTAALTRIREVLVKYPGERQVIIKLQATGQRFRAKEKVKPGDVMFDELYSIIGKERR